MGESEGGVFIDSIWPKMANNWDGLIPEAVREYYNSPISKAVGISVVEMDFKDSLYNGVISIKLVIQIYQSTIFILRNAVGIALIVI